MRRTEASAVPVLRRAAIVAQLRLVPKADRSDSSLASDEGGNELNRCAVRSVEGAMQLIDIGANLTHRSFAPDLLAVLARGKAAGVVQSIVTGTSLRETAAALALTRDHPGALFSTAGVHPHHATELDDAGDTFLRSTLAHDAVVAVGETGLDYFRDLAPRSVQRAAFERQLQMATDVGKPVFLHERAAHADFVSILDAFIGRLPGAVVHCFTGTQAELFAYLDRGCHIGITGWVCDERRGRHLVELLRHVPADRLMVETDAPYLLPRGLSSTPKVPRRNEPMFLRDVVAAVARARSEPVEVTASATTANAQRFFRLPG